MTAPAKPPETTEVERAKPDPWGPWTAKMIDGALFTPVGRGAKIGYAKDEVDAFKDRVVERVAQLEKDYSSAHEQVLQLQAATRERHDPQYPSVMAVDAMVRADDQAEADIAAARREYSEIRVRTRQLNDETVALRREAEDYLAAARAIADTPTATAVEARELPPEPQNTGNMAVDIEARSQHLQECRQRLDAWREEDEMRLRAHEERRHLDDERRAALDDKVGRLVEALDQLETVVPAARARVIDLTMPVTEAVETVAEAS